MSGLAKVTYGGWPGLVLTERPTADADYRWEARIKGRSCGGYLTGHGPTQHVAGVDLAKQYEEELSFVRAAVERMPREAAPRKRR